MVDSVAVVPLQFAGGRKVGDFGWMVRQADYDDTLFIFNDNEEEFLSHRRHRAEAATDKCSSGGGNAVIRPEQCRTVPRAAGIPTGKESAGYRTLDPATRGVIDDAFAVVDELLDTGRYSKVAFSADASGLLGVSIFRPGLDVIGYITGRLYALAR